MTPESVISLASIVTLILPEIFKMRYSETYAWDAMRKSYTKDSPTIQAFFQDLEKGRVGEIFKKDILAKYFAYGFEVVGTYTSLFLSIISSLLFMFTFRMSNIHFLGGAALLLMFVVLTYEYGGLISETRKEKIRLTVYTRRLRISFKVLMILLNIVIIVLRSFVPVVAQLPA